MPISPALRRTPAVAFIVIPLLFAYLSLTAPGQAASAVSGNHVGGQGLRELVGLRSANSNTFLRADGARVVRIHPRQINFRDANGAWTPFDNTLEQGADGSWHPAGSSLPISLPTSLGTGAVVVGSGTQRLSFSLEHAAGSQGRSESARRIYASALPGVNVSYVALGDGVRETLLLSSRSAPLVYRYKLSYPADLRPALTKVGSVVFLDRSGRVLYTLAAPTAGDSSQGSHGPTPLPVHYALSSDQETLSLLVDRAWLRSSERVFPVKVDPDVYGEEEHDCAIVSHAYANVSLCGGPLYIGADSESPKDVGRALLHFDLSSIPSDSVVLRSQLGLWFEADTSKAPLKIEAYGLTGGFGSGATWNKADGAVSWTEFGGDFSAFPGGATTVSDAERENYVTWEFDPWVQQWIRDPASNHGILLKAHDETMAGYDTFADSDNGESLPEPYLEVIYTPRMGTPPEQTMITQSIGNGGTMGVNVANGNLSIKDSDVRLEGSETTKYATTFNRSYNSLDENATGSSFGPGWKQEGGEDALLYPNPDGSYILHQPDGSFTRFGRAPWADGSPEAGDLAFTSEVGVAAKLIAHADGTRTLVYDETGAEWKFDNSENGFPAEIVEPEGAGNALSLSYTGSRLTSLSDEYSHVLTLARDPSKGNVTSIALGKTTQIKYAYNKEGQLESMEGKPEKFAQYVYDKAGRLEENIDSKGTRVITYDGAGRVEAIRVVRNGTATKVGKEDEITSFSYGSGSTSVTNPEGEVKVYYYDEADDPLEDPDTQEEAAEFYADYAGISKGPAESDLDLQDSAAPLDSQLYEQLGDAYVGMWLDPGSGHLQIGMASGASEQEVSQDLQELGLYDVTDIIPESASWKDLGDGQEALNSSMSKLENAGLLSTAVRSSKDSVEAREAKAITAPEEAEVSAQVTKMSVPVDIVKSGEPSLYATPTTCGHSLCQRPLRGGVHIESRDPENIYSSQLGCTAGFIAQSATDEKYYVLTAGHCVRDAGVGANWYTSSPESRTEGKEGQKYYLYNGGIIGHGHSYVFGQHQNVPGGTSSQGDAGLISIEPLKFWGEYLEPILYDYGHDESYPVVGTRYTPNSRQTHVVCTSGAPFLKPPAPTKYDPPEFEGGSGLYPISRALCGMVVHTDVTITYEGEGEGESTKVTKLAEIQVCSSHTTNGIQPGASGSPVFKNYLAYGLISGNGDEAGCVGYYEGVTDAEKALHVHVLVVSWAHPVGLN